MVLLLPSPCFPFILFHPLGLALLTAFMGRVDGGIAPSAPHRIPDLRLSRIRLFTRLID